MEILVTLFQKYHVLTCLIEIAQKTEGKKQKPWREKNIAEQKLNDKKGYDRSTAYVQNTDFIC